MSLREGRDEDADELMRLIRACWREYASVVFDPAEHDELLAIATTYQQRGGTCWVVERENNIIASVAVAPSRGNGMELEKLYVDPAERRQGLGARLCSHVEQYAREHKAGFIELWTDTRFAGAHKLYERLGYVRGPDTRALDDLSRSVEYYFRKDMTGDQA
ncbi:MAG: GNAT family N-acetyltransferase [Gammaproteobacteria bacterium]